MKDLVDKLVDDFAYQSFPKNAASHFLALLPAFRLCLWDRVIHIDPILRWPGNSAHTAWSNDLSANAANRLPGPPEPPPESRDGRANQQDFRVGECGEQEAYC